MTRESAAQFAEVIGKCNIVVCVGSGGVGKTTTSAVIALQEAIRGRKVLVLTIDPARRLANSLGVTQLTNRATQLPIERFTEIGVEPAGELWAMMLDMKESFDHVVRRYAPQETQDEILQNRIYQYFSTSLAGTQEYAAAERLFELHEEEDYDLIVLDTPPTTHALDFMDAPRRLEDAIENKALQWLYRPSVLAGKTGLGIFSLGTSYVMKTLSKLTGAQLLDEFSVFLRSFSTLFEGLKERSQRVREVLASETSTFVVVTAPDPTTMDEATYFHERLGEERAQVGAFVINRVHAPVVEPEELARPVVSIASSLTEVSPTLAALSDEARRDLTEKLVRNAREFQVLADVDAASIESLRAVAGADLPIRQVPFFSTDIHSLRGLDMARKALFFDD